MGKWAYRDLVRTRFPSVRFRYDKPFVDLGNVITGAGAYTSYSVILHLIEKHKNRELAPFTFKMYLTTL